MTSSQRATGTSTSTSGGDGAATHVGLGLALAQPERSVVVVTGDGEQMMGVGSLASVGAQRPPNLTIVVLDNGHFGETGMQPSHTSLGTDLSAVAKGFGIVGGYLVAQQVGLTWSFATFAAFALVGAIAAFSVPRPTDVPPERDSADDPSQEPAVPACWTDPDALMLDPARCQRPSGPNHEEEPA